MSRENGNLGETRIGDWNPSGSADVNEIKAKFKEIVDLIDRIDGDPRCKQLALTNSEQASMWAVKSLFVNES